MITTLIAAALAAAAPAAPTQPADAHAQHDQHPAGQHQGMDCCKHMKGETRDCCKDKPAPEKAKCCADRAANHAEHHKQ